MLNFLSLGMFLALSTTISDTYYNFKPETSLQEVYILEDLR